MFAGDQNCGYRSPRVLAASKGPTVLGTQEEAEYPVGKVTAAKRKTRKVYSPWQKEELYLKKY